MKVVQFLYSGLGGHGSVAFSLVDGDAERRWTNAFGFVGIEPLLGDYRARCEAGGIEYAYFQARKGRPWANWAAIVRWLDRIKPDAIICHGGPALLPSAFHARSRQVPLLLVEHTSLPARGRSDMLYTKLGMRLANGVVVLTDELAAGLKAGLGESYRSDKVVIIANGVDTKRFRPPPLRRRAHRIGMAGRMTGVKLHDDLIRALQHLRQLQPQKGWKLSFAGDGEKREQLQALANELTPGAAEFTGTLTEDALAEWYRSLDLYLHASKAEALSTAILQAMATELPIVASDVPGIASLLPLNVGVLVKNDNPEVWAKAIISLAGSPELTSELGHNARELCIDRYNHRRMHAAYEALILSTAKGTVPKTKS